ncbi:MAG: phosphodiesterase, partial [Cyanobacteria bacterium P01_D01_bin.123]
SDLFLTSKDTGPDDAIHAPHGLMIFQDPYQPRLGEKLHDAQLYDIIPTLLTRYDLPTPARVRGKVLPI